MAQAEVLSLVATAVDRATPVLQQVQKSLDQIKRSAGGLEASMAQSRSAVQGYGDAFRGTAANMNAFQTATQQTARALRNAQGQTTGFANTLGREVASSITRVQSAIVSATVSIAAFKNQLQASRELSEFAQATGFARDMVVGLTHAGQDLGVPAEKMEQVIGQLGQKFQDLKLLGGGDFYKQLVNVPEMRRAAEEMSAVGEQIAGNLITQEEGSQKQFEILQRSLRDYREKYGEFETRGMLRRANLPEELANLTRVPWEELKQKADAYAASVRQLDPEQVRKFWEAWHKLSIELSNFTTGILGPLLPKLSEFMTLFAAPELKKFTETQLPQVMSDLMTAYGELTKFFDGKELDWEKIFNMHAVQEVDARFEYMVAVNRRRWLQLKELYGGSSADVTEALKNEAEAQAALTKITGPPKPGIVPPVAMPGSVFGPESSIAPTPEDADKRAADLEGAAQRRAEERARRRQQQQPQRFTGGSTIEGRNWTHDLLKDSPMSTNIEDRRREAAVTGDDRTRATTDLTDEIRKLNANFLRGVGESFAAGTGGAVKFAPSGGDGDLRTGTGPGGGPPGGTIPGGGPRGGGPPARRGPTGPTIPAPVIPPQPVPIYPRGESKAAGKHIGPAPEATRPAPGAAPAEVPVYGPGESKAAGKNIGAAPDATMPAPDGGAVAGRAEFLTQHRAGIMQELQSDPGKMDRFQRMVQAEIGNQGPLAKRAFIQSTIDRWAARGESVDQGLSSPYFPNKSRARAARTAVSDPTRQEYQTYIDEAGKGRADAPGATGNASDEPGNLVLSGHRRRGEVVIESQGEGFVRESDKRDAAFRRRMAEAERRAPGTAPPTGTQQPQSPGATSDHDANMTLLRERGGHDKRTDPKDTGGLHPVMAQRLAQAVRDYEGETGQQAKIGQMYRDIATQAQYREEYLRTGKGLAAPPGPNAPHQGRATDVPSGPFRDWLYRNAAKYRIEFLKGKAYAVDPVHVQIPLDEWEKIKDQKAPPAASAAVEDRSAPPDPYYERRRSAPVTADTPDAGGPKAAGKNLGPKAEAPTIEDKPDTGGSKAAGKNLGPAPVAAADDDDDDVKGLQAGGSANKGKPYIVGEGGPELFMPFQSGMVLPHTAMKYLKGLQIGGRSLGEYFNMAQSPGRMLSSVLGGGSPLSGALGGLGGGGRGGGGNPLSGLMSGFGGGGGNPLQMLSGFMGFQQGGAIYPPGTPGSEFPGSSASGRAEPLISDEFFKRIPGVGAVVETFQALKSVEDERNSAMEKIREETRGPQSLYDPGSLRGGGTPQKIAASGNIDINIGSTGVAALAKSEKSGLFENINMNRNLAEQHSSQRS